MEIYLAICISALLFSVIALILGFFSLAKTIGMEKSTHQVQMVPIESQQANGISLDEGIGMTPQNAAEMMKKMYPNIEE